MSHLALFVSFSLASSFNKRIYFFKKVIKGVGKV